jgi:hypothetical protein
MFLDEPHRASRYYATLLRSIGSRIFAEDHKFDPYYTAAFSYYKLEFLFRNRSLDSSLKPARYHMLMALRFQVSGPDLPRPNAKALEAYCQKINEVLWDDSKALAAFKAAAKVAIPSDLARPPGRDDFKTQASTNEILSSLGVPVVASEKV